MAYVLGSLRQFTSEGGEMSALHLALLSLIQGFIYGGWGVGGGEGARGKFSPQTVQPHLQTVCLCNANRLNKACPNTYKY